MRTISTTQHRPDYVKFVFRGPLDLCETYKLRFIETIAAGEEFDGSESGYHVKPICKHKDGHWSYAYEVYGPLAQVVRYFDWKAWSPLLQRFDVRIDYDLTIEGVRALREHLEQNGSGGRNVHTFNSRVRNKKDGRDAGGFGVGVGSHKSSARLTAYKRGKEMGGLEYQLSGKRVNTGVGVVDMLRKAGHEQSHDDPWAEFRQQVFTIAVKDFERSTGMSYNDMLDTLATGTSDTPLERSMRQIELHMSQLDKSGLEVVRAMAQEALALDWS